MEHSRRTRAAEEGIGTTVQIGPHGRKESCCLSYKMNIKAHKREEGMGERNSVGKRVLRVIACVDRKQTGVPETWSRRSVRHHTLAQEEAEEEE